MSKGEGMKGPVFFRDRQDFSTITVWEEDSVLTITLNRSKHRNAIDPVMIDELNEVTKELRPGCPWRVVAIKGAGDSFCSGLDLEVLVSNQVFPGDRFFDVLLDLWQCPIPVVLVAHGQVIGAGMGFVACADLVLSSVSTEFSFIETKLGLTPTLAAPFVLQKLSLPRATELFLSARKFNAQAARDMGLVHDVVPFFELFACFSREIELILANSHQAVVETKRLLRGPGKSWSEIRQDVVESFDQLIADPDVAVRTEIFFKNRKIK